MDDASGGSTVSPSFQDKYRIDDKKSFEEVTGKGHEVAGLYSFFLLDCLVELAYRVSIDFFRKPEYYTDLGDLDGIPAQLASLRSMYGSDPQFLSQPQRDEIYVALFGHVNRSDDSDANAPSAAQRRDFPTLSYQLIDATTRLSEQVFTTGEGFLRDAIARTHEVFKTFLLGKQGASVAWSRQKALAYLTEKVVYPILRSEGIARVFKVSLPPNDDWPYVVDSQGSKLVHAISSELMKEEPDKIVTEAWFSDLQTSALRGAEALAAVIDFDKYDHADTDKQDVLIGKVYTWGTMLRGLQAGSVAKWQDPATYARDGQPS